MLEALSMTTPTQLLATESLKELPRRRGRRSMAEMRAARDTGATTTRPVLVVRTPAETLGARVRLARKRLGLSQQELADPQYVASYISAIERDKIQPSLKALELIARRLGEPVEYFLYGGYGSGALQEPSEVEPVVKSNFSLAARDNMLEAEMLLEQAAAEGSRTYAGQLLDKAAGLLKQNPEHQLTEHDRALTARLEGQLLLQQGDTLAAESRLTVALGLAERTEQPELEIEITYWLGRVATQARQPEKALSYYNVARDLLERHSTFVTPEMRLKVLHALTQTQLALGNSDAALALFTETERLKREYNRPRFLVECYRQLARTYQERHDLVRARKYLTLAQALYSQLADGQTTLRLSAGVSELLTALNRLDESERVLTRVTDDDADMDGGDLALTSNALAGLRIRQGQFDEARKLARTALKEARAIGDDFTAGSALRISAEVEAQLGNRAGSQELYEEAIGLLEKVNANGVLSEVYKTYGEALSRWGDFENAVNYLKKAYETRK
jgi:tetratricopeptide (TPR) repeat protein